MVTQITEASHLRSPNYKDTRVKRKKPNEVEKTKKDGAIEALCRAGNFYNFET